MQSMGTGSRSMIMHPDAREHYEYLRHIILAARDADDELVLISGMAEGFDEAIAKIGMREGIPYIACVPNPTYGNYYWRDHSVTGRNRIETFRELMSHAQDIIFVCNSIYQNGEHSNFVRNQYMVDICDMAYVYKPQSSGTRDAVRRLDRAEKPYFILPF